MREAQAERSHAGEKVGAKVRAVRGLPAGNGESDEMTVLAIDPGPTESAFVICDETNVEHFAKVPNFQLSAEVKAFCNLREDPKIVIEMIASYGMPVGAEVFETCVWIGRFIEVCGDSYVCRLTRNAIKNHLCHSSKAKDANIRQALIDRFGGSTAIGTKKAQGPLYGVSGDVWAALAVAVTWMDQQGQQRSKA